MAVEQVTLSVGENFAVGHLENEFGPGVRCVGMLTTGTSRRTKLPLQLGVGDGEVVVDLKWHLLGR